MLRVAALDGSTESLFWDVANRDPLELFWFIYDWKLYRDVTKIWLALDEAKRVAGLLLLHRDTVIQFRGSREAVKALLDYASAKGGFEVQAPLDCEELVTGKFGSEGKVHMVLMKLQKGEEKIRITTEPARLGVEDAEEVAALLREADPLWWGEITAERLAGGSLKEALWFGIRQDKHIVSVGSTRLTNLGISNIGIVATKEGYRNKGYATSVTSALVKEILKVSNTAIIHVLADNKPAVRTYTKVGFKPYKTYLAIRSKT